MQLPRCLFPYVFALPICAGCSDAEGRKAGSGDENDITTAKVPEHSASGVLVEPTMRLEAGELRDTKTLKLVAAVESRKLESFGTPHDYPSSHAAFLTPTDVVAYAYCPISDSGVLVARLRIMDKTATVLWAEFAQPLGVDHSKYRQRVKLNVRNKRLLVESDGASTFIETRDLDTGELLDRSVSASEAPDES